MIDFATRRPAVVWAACVALLVAGALAFARLPLATRSTVELPRLQISAGLSGAAPEVIETYLTSPLEAAAQGVRGVRRVNSNSYDDYAMLTVELDERADVQMTRLAMLERIELLRAELPPGVSGPSVSNYVPEGLEEAPLLSLTITGPFTAGALQTLLAERVSPRLSAVPGVAGVQVRGGTALGVAISYDPVMLRRIGVSPQLLSDALNGARVVQALGVQSVSGRGSGADVSTVAPIANAPIANAPIANASVANASIADVQHVVRNVVLRDQPNALEDLAKLPVRSPSGRVFRLGELTVIRADEDARGMFYRVDGRPAVSLDVTRQPGADAIRTAQLLRDAVAALRPELPAAVQLRVTNDESEELASELRDLTQRGALAFVAVLLVLALMLRRWRAVAVVMGSTLVAIAATALSLYLLGIPANLLTLAGLGMGVGVLVQNGLVVVQRLGLAPATAAGRSAAARQIAPAVIGSTLATAVVLVPFLYLQGNARAAFVPFAAAFALALFWSVITALLVVPALGIGSGIGAGTAVTERARAQQNAAHRATRDGTAALAEWPRMRRVYAVVLARALRWRAVTLVLTAVTLGVLTWGFIVKVPRSSFGGFGERRTTLSVGLSFPRGSDPQSLDGGIREFERLVVGRPEVEQVRASSRGTTSAQMLVTFTRQGGYTAVPMELQELLTQRAVLVGGASISVYGEGPGFSSGGGGGSMSTFRLRVQGFAYNGVGSLANDLKSRLERIPRVRDVRITSGGYFGGERGVQVTIDPDRAALARYGVNAQQLGFAVAREVRGAAGRQLIEIDGDELPVTLKAAGARDRSLDELQESLVPNAAGTPVRIGDLAVVSEREALSTILREDQQYVLQVAYDFRGPPKLANRTHTAFVKSLSAPAGYTIVDMSNNYGFGNDESEQALWLVFALGVVLVLLAVALVFDSVWGSAMVFLSLPLSLAGVAAAFWATGTAFTREAAVGVILVVGLAVNHAILMVDAALLKRRAKRDDPARRADSVSLNAGEVLRAMLDRSGMIVFVTLASLASLAPLSIGTDANRLFGAIALATAGGTVAGTLGVLFVLPALLVGRRRGARGMFAGKNG